MKRLLAISLGLTVLLSALTTTIVYSQRRAFPAQQQLLFELGEQNSIRRVIYRVHLNSSFGDDMRLVFDPAQILAVPIVSGIDCSPNNQSLILWSGSLFRYEFAYRASTLMMKGQGAGQVSAWSPDGTRIAYVSSLAEQTPGEIFVIDSDGARQRQITSDTLPKTSLSWSPDGKRIAYTYYENDNRERQGLAIVDVASGAITPIWEATARINDASWSPNGSPNGSPDGERIAFDMSAGDSIDIYTIKPDGSGLTNLHGADVQNILPRWSPDGMLISFSARPLRGNYQLYVMNANGSDPYLVFRDLHVYRKSIKTNVWNRCWLNESSGTT